uniref:Uncharacterized protein n=1 Tax=Cajanus cajan TaxID=3821 RepID=A0A151TXA0_CAJCA|nr:hypothetical protein KK1_010849 [Cajanus cajan]
MVDQTKFHPALVVNTVKNFIPITLEMEKGHYSSWVELFKIHCRHTKSSITFSHLHQNQLNLGPFISWMLKMSSFMVNSMKLYTCINRWVSEIPFIPIMCAY